MDFEKKDSSKRKYDPTEAQKKTIKRIYDEFLDMKEIRILDHSRFFF
jgi:hypothetical protein